MRTISCASDRRLDRHIGRQDLHALGQPRFHRRAPLVGSHRDVRDEPVEQLTTGVQIRPEMRTFRRAHALERQERLVDDILQSLRQAPEELGVRLQRFLAHGEGLWMSKQVAGRQRARDQAPCARGVDRFSQRRGERFVQFDFDGTARTQVRRDGELHTPARESRLHAGPERRFDRTQAHAADESGDRGICD